MGRKRKSLRDRALDTMLHSRIVATEDDINRDLTDAEVLNQAEYQLETIPHAGYEEWEEKEYLREIKAIIKIAGKRGIKSDSRYLAEI